MTVGIIMLVHTAFDRAEQVARHWTRAGCPVVIHVDKALPLAQYEKFAAALSDIATLKFAPCHRCEWGTWGLVSAVQDASEIMLSSFKEVRHVYLTSGACLPLRPVEDLISYLAERPQTDFIESANVATVLWPVGGLDEERFTLRFPFSWKKHRYLFDKYVDLQRRIGFKRNIPDGIVPHMGSQWWCLTRQTLSAILQDPKRPVFDKYFKRVWIPDESYFQTLARRYSVALESRSLTLSKFDFQGRPHIFYDDHLRLLRRSDCFVARKIWPRANKLYDAFLAAPGDDMNRAEPDLGKVDRIFAKAVQRRTRGRSGLYMQSRFPRSGYASGTAAKYSVFHGFSDLFEDFADWMHRTTGTNLHGHLFAPDRVEFAGGKTIVAGGLSDSAALRDANCAAFLTNLLWNTRGERQCFLFGPTDDQRIRKTIAYDRNAQVSVITGAWAIPLFKSNVDFADIREEATKLQQVEAEHLAILRRPDAKARVRVWTLAEFIDAPIGLLQTIIDEMGEKPSQRLAEAPRMADLTGFGQFLQNLKNQGVQPNLTGNFPANPEPMNAQSLPQKPYLVR
ncbi:DUF5927 domain-containing protein [Primorskyibacter marinus]|uniref:DUF5927 domain-containing protein n=1 Tax=Primorskyibacter marinus TaxID=1977320 RepID=UPI000E304632|nr:beta-1,6-N-acetylglucosaminyltransferase [Primorskyibacter marinus]